MCTFNWTAPKREYFLDKDNFDLESVGDYLEEYPMPSNGLFISEQEAIQDLYNSTGIITVEIKNISDEFIIWYGGLIDLLAND